MFINRHGCDGDSRVGGQRGYHYRASGPARGGGAASETRIRVGPGILEMEWKAPRLDPRAVAEGASWVLLGARAMGEKARPLLFRARTVGAEARLP